MPSLKISANRGTLLLEIIISVALFSLVITSVFSLVVGNEEIVGKTTAQRQSLYKISGIHEEALVSLEKNNLDKIATSTFISPCIIELTSNDDRIKFGSLFVEKIYTRGIEGDCGGFEPKGNWSDVTTETLPDIHIPLKPIDIFTQEKVNAADSIGPLIFCAMNDFGAQLAVYSNESSLPTLVATSSLPGVTGSFPYALSIFYFDSKIYIGTHRTAGNEFHIFDVSIPSTPVWLGSLELNHNINSITIKPPYAYLATSGNIHDLIIVDITDPKRLIRAVNIDLPGTHDSLSIFLKGPHLYLGKKRNTLGQPEFFVLNISSSTPSLVGTYKTDTSINSMRVFGDLAFLGTNSGIQIIDISDLKNIKNIAQYIPSLSISLIDYDFNSIYASSNTTIYKLLPRHDSH